MTTDDNRLNAHIFAHKYCIYLVSVYNNTHSQGETMIETNSRKIVKRLKDEGFEHAHTVGSHQKFVKGDRRVTVPHPKKDIPMGTARQIAKQAGWL